MLPIVANQLSFILAPERSTGSPGSLHRTRVAGHRGRESLDQSPNVQEQPSILSFIALHFLPFDLQTNHSILWWTTQRYLKVVDEYNDNAYISTFVTAGRTCGPLVLILLIHQVQSADNGLLLS